MKRFWPRPGNRGVLFAWLLFLVANACPAVAPDVGAWNRPDPEFFPGYVCTAVFWPFWLSNAALLLSPGLLWMHSGRKWQRVVRWTVTTICFISFLAGLALQSQFRAVHVGHILWVTSFLVAGFAAVPWKGRDSPG